MKEIWRHPTIASAAAAQERCLRDRLTALAGTAFGKEHEIIASMPYSDYARRVPSLTLRRLEYFAERTRSGESDVLSEGCCAAFIRSSNSNAAPHQIFPFPQEQRLHLRRSLSLAIGLFNARIANSGIWRGRCLFLDRPNLAKAGPPSGAEAPYSFCTALHACMPAAVRTAPPYRSIAARRSVSMVCASPERLLIDPLTNPPEDAKEGSARDKDQPPWPRLACWMHTGGFVQPYASELRRRLRSRAAWHDLYGGAFGLIAAQDKTAEGLRLFCNTGLFFEFCRAEDAIEYRQSDLGPKLIPLKHVEVGVDYALFITTPAGLCRHPTGDVVRFLSLNPPRIIVLGKIDEVLDLAKENVRARDCALVLETIAGKQGWSVVHFHVTTLTQRTLVGQAQICHEWWIELQPGTEATPTGPVLSRLLDDELMRSHPRYAERRRAGVLQPPLVRLLMPGIFAQWLQSSRLFRAQVPCCQSDRTIADALARLARFYA